MWFSSDLMKLQGVLLQKWFIGYRLALCLSLICFRRHQNGVHKTLVIITWNEHNLLMWPYFFTKWCLMRLSKITVSLTWRVSKCVVFSGRQPFFVYGDLRFKWTRNSMNSTRHAQIQNFMLFQSFQNVLITNGIGILLQVAAKSSENRVSIRTVNCSYFSG